MLLKDVDLQENIQHLYLYLARSPAYLVVEQRKVVRGAQIYFLLDFH